MMENIVKLINESNPGHDGTTSLSLNGSTTVEGSGKHGTYSFVCGRSGKSYMGAITDEIMMNKLWEMELSEGQSLIVQCDLGIKSIVKGVS